MRAIRIHQTGGPEVLKLEEVDLPKPGKGEVRLRQHAVGVNFIDVYFRNGFYSAPGLPFTPGHEGAGEVVEVGPEVKDFKPGDRVAYCGRDRRLRRGAQHRGAAPLQAAARHFL